MKFLRNLFSGTDETNNTRPYGTGHNSFLDCLNIVREWSAMAKFDPDVDFNDTKMRAALRATVSCPYCTATYSFGEAVHIHGVQVDVECPICHSTPNDFVQDESVYGFR